MLPRRFATATRFLATTVVAASVVGASALAVPAPDVAVETASVDAPEATGSGQSVADVASLIGVDALTSAGRSGAGVDVAIIDTGVSRVRGLGDVEIIDGPVFATERATPRDGAGHGTHLTGIIASTADEARIVNVKAGDDEGNATASEVVAAIEWVTANRTARDLDIRVLNLAIGVDVRDERAAAALEAAVEAATDAGIVVVVSAGNDRDVVSLDAPATSAAVIAVGAVDTDGTVADFSRCGTAARRPDVLAPGRSIVSLLAPGSIAARDHRDAHVGQGRIKGTGTSQAAAVVSGAIALLLEERPELSPAAVKTLLTGTAVAVADDCAGAGTIDVAAADVADAPQTTQAVSRHAAVELLDATISWAGAHWAGAHWAGAHWAGAHWAGAHWAGAHWAGAHWAGAHWAGAHWAGAHWAGAHWA